MLESRQSDRGDGMRVRERRTNPSYEYKQSARDQDETDVPARPSSPFVDKDLDAIGEEDEVYPLKKGMGDIRKGSGRNEDVP
jgi:hypothetical protein